MHKRQRVDKQCYTGHGRLQLPVAQECTFNHSCHTGHSASQVKSPDGVGAAAAGVAPGGGGGLAPEAPTSCKPLGLGDVPGLGEGLLTPPLGVGTGDAPGLTAGVTPGTGLTPGGEAPYGEGTGGLGEVTGDGVEVTPGVAVGLLGVGDVVIGGGGDEGIIRAAGGGWAMKVEAGVTAGAGALAAKHLAQVIWQ